MFSKTFLAIVTIACIIAIVSAQSSDGPLASLQRAASMVAASATNTSPAAPSNTGKSAGLSLASGLSSTVMMQAVVLACAFVATNYLI